MRIIKRELVLCAAITAFVMLCALAWGHPFVDLSSNAAPALTAAQPAQTMPFRGAVVASQGQLMLRDSSGEVFQLDGAQKAQPFVGKTVTITGGLDSATRVIHIDSIAPAA